MAEGLQTADGVPITLGTAEPNGMNTADSNGMNTAERDFHAAMAAPSSDEPQAAAPPRVDHDAPYGHKEDGTPRKRAPGPGRPPKARTVAKSAGKAQQTAETPEQATQRRTDGIKGIVQVGAAITAMMYGRTQNKAWLADTYTIADNAEPLADAIGQTCEISPGFAKAIDKVTEIGPYAALVGVSLTMGAQLAANHGVAAGRMLGAVPPEQVIAAHQTDEVPDAGSESATG